MRNFLLILLSIVLCISVLEAQELCKVTGHVWTDDGQAISSADVTIVVDGPRRDPGCGGGGGGCGGGGNGGDKGDDGGNGGGCGGGGCGDDEGGGGCGGGGCGGGGCGDDEGGGGCHGGGCGGGGCGDGEGGGCHGGGCDGGCGDGEGGGCHGGGGCGGGCGGGGCGDDEGGGGCHGGGGGCGGGDCGGGGCGGGGCGGDCGGCGCGEKQTQTGLNGDYEFNDLQEGSYRIFVTSEGFVTTEELVEIGAGDEAEVNFFLAPSDENLDVSDHPLVQPTDLALVSVYPNPFNPVTSVHLNLNQNEDVIVTLCDLTGRQISQLFSGNLEAGSHTLNLDGAGLTAGTYLVMIKTGNSLYIQKALLEK